MTTEKPTTLAAKLARIGKEIGAVSKSGTNQQQKYNYIEYGVVAGRIRELFDTYGVIIVPRVDDYQTDVVATKAGGRGYHYVLKMSFRLINSDDRDDSIEATWLGESADYGDKGINKAETSGTKYFLMRLFNVSEKDEGESDKYSPEIASTTRVSNRPAQSYAPEAEYTKDEIDAAIDTLSDATDINDLNLRFLKIGSIRELPEIIKVKDELKHALAMKDVDVATANGQELLDKQFKETK